MASPKRKTSQNDFFDRAANDEADAEVVPMPVVETPQNERQSRQQTTLRVGEILKRERERKGYDLQQIADYLCIRRGLLSAIENSRYEEFPADAYVIGFLRSYADLIGLDGQEAINHYRMEMAGRRRKPDLVLPTPISEGRAPTAVIMGAAALASLLIYILWYAFSTSDRTSVSTPPALPTAVETSSIPSEPITTAATAVETVTSTATPSGIAIAAPAPAAKTLTTTTTDTATTPTATPSGTPAHISIKADQSSWILIADSKGQTLYDHVMKPGDVYNVPSQKGLTLTTGNGAGIVVTLDGTDLPRLSSSTSHIVRNIPLDAGALKALPTQPAQ